LRSQLSRLDFQTVAGIIFICIRIVQQNHDVQDSKEKSAKKINADSSGNSVGINLVAEYVLHHDAADGDHESQS
jgi:hypothetical protein